MPNQSLGGTISSWREDAAGNHPFPSPVPSLPSVFWDDVPLALTDGPRLRAVTAAAARCRIRAGLTGTEARSRCAALCDLPWDDVAIADEVRRATAAFLAASPQVAAVTGAPGCWWIGASGLEALGGEAALARTLLRLARAWHPQARVAIADSCVAARAGTWDQDSVGIVIVPPGGDASYLGAAPLGLIPMDEDLRETLSTLGIRTAGAFAALPSNDVEQRWGDIGLTAWRLARGEDRRRPVPARPDAPRSASTELTPSMTAIEPVLFLVRAALDRLVRDLLADGRAAATVAITLTLDDARGALPGTSPAHTITREVRLARPLARTAPLLERCRALLARWSLSAPVCGVTVAITATAPLSGEQGDLLDPAWRDPAAADAAFARLRAELGRHAVVFPVARDEHQPERTGDWLPVEEQTTDDRRQTTDVAAFERSTLLPDSSSPLGVRRSALSAVLRQLEQPEPVDVECEDGTPRVIWWRARRLRLEHTLGPERLAGDWWKDGYARDYWRCRDADGESEFVLFHDRTSTNGGWYVQGWYD